MLSAPPGSGHRAGEGSGGQKDQAHGQDVLVGHTGGHHLHLGVEVQLPVLEAGDRQGDQEDHDGGGLVKALLDLQTILEQKAAAR